MKKSEQLAINEKVLEYMQSYNDWVDSRNVFPRWERLRSCSAEVAKVGNWYVLRSYHTIVAIIDTQTDTLYDFLRYVYGYTSTSAQHISKFNQDYGMGKYGCTNRLTYREV